MKLYQHIDTLWHYMQLNHSLEKADCILVLGSNDPRVAEHAVSLYQQGFANKILFSGGFGRLTAGLFARSEADTFADIARDLGVPADDIVIENRSTNSGENVLFSAQLCTQLGLNVRRVILVQKPYMERRAYATFVKQWPMPIDFVAVSSTQQAFTDYFNDDIELYTVVEAMLGDFERIKTYPEKGFQIAQLIPIEVETAYQAIKARI